MLLSEEPARAQQTQVLLLDFRTLQQCDTRAYTDIQTAALQQNKLLDVSPNPHPFTPKLCMHAKVGMSSSLRADVGWLQVQSYLVTTRPGEAQQGIYQKAIGL